MQQVKFYVKDKETGERFAMLEQAIGYVEDCYFCGNCYFFEENLSCPRELYCYQHNNGGNPHHIYRVMD